jgi:NAD(P)-dependent dehydrogenase (short-subunit alcohol dehydrogenase family)
VLYAVTGAASGIGAATRSLLESRGHAVIGVDLRDAEVVADLATAEGRAAALAVIGERAPDGLDGFVPCAGLAGETGGDPALLISVNYFGAVELVSGLRPLLLRAAERGGAPAVVFLSSNSVTAQPGWPRELAEACLAGDEQKAREVATAGDVFGAYPASKAALAWWARREGVKPEWAGAGIRLNAVAPGLIATPMTERMRNDPTVGVFLDAFPSALDRPGRPEEVAALISFLLSPESSLLVGSVVFVDGGTDALIHPSRPEPMD